MNGLGNTPRNRTIVGDTHDDAAFACHEAGCLSHISLPRNLIDPAYGIGR
jgi:hypothetical protein